MSPPDLEITTSLITEWSFVLRLYYISILVSALVLTRESLVLNRYISKCFEFSYQRHLSLYNATV